MTRSFLGLCAALAVTVCHPPAGASAQSADAIFQSANEAYYQGSHAAAAEGYRLLLESGIDDPVISFNLATAYAQLGQYGRAIRWYEHTLRLDPGDDEAEENLAEVRRALGQRQAEARGEATVQTGPGFVASVVRPISEGTLAWVLLVFDFAFFGLLIARRYVHAESGRLALGIAIPLVGLVLLLSVGGLAVKSGALTEGEPAVVLVDGAKLHEGPDPRAQVRGNAGEGEPARIVDRSGDWVRVELSGGRSGWASVDEVGAI